LVRTGRGGDVTLHAPGQLVAYPIIKLSPDRQDVRKYVQHLTEVMRLLVLSFGIDGGTIEKLIGLWIDRETPSSWLGQGRAVSPAKIGAIGVRISRWVTSHGFALNLTTDLSLYGLIVPCGISEYPVSSVLNLTDRRPSVAEQAKRALHELNRLLGKDEPNYRDCSSLTLDQVSQLAYQSRPLDDFFD
jgi:lipoyl(octanoyl) transferase